MGVFFSNSVANVKKTPGIINDVIANQPLQSIPGMLFVSSDTNELYFWDGAAWQLIGGGGGGVGTWEQVMTMGSNLTTNHNSDLNSTIWSLSNGEIQVTEDLLFSFMETGGIFKTYFLPGIVTGDRSFSFPDKSGVVAIDPTFQEVLLNDSNLNNNNTVELLSNNFTWHDANDYNFDLISNINFTNSNVNFGTAGNSTSVIFDNAGSGNFFQFDNSLLSVFQTYQMPDNSGVVPLTLNGFASDAGGNILAGIEEILSGGSSTTNPYDLHMTNGSFSAENTIGNVLMSLGPDNISWSYALASSGIDPNAGRVNSTDLLIPDKDSSLFPGGKNVIATLDDFDTFFVPTAGIALALKTTEYLAVTIGGAPYKIALIL